MRIIDGDGHVSERNISWADVLEEPYRSRAPKTVQDNRGVNFTMIDGKLIPKPVGKGCSFVGAPRNRLLQPTTGMPHLPIGLKTRALKASTPRDPSAQRPS